MSDDVVEKLMGLNEYARHRGCAPNAVTKAEDSGRIAAAVMRAADGEFVGIDWQLADQLWASRTDPGEAAKQGKVYADAADDGKAAVGVPQAPADDQHGYMAARGQREQYQAERARLDLLERMGQLMGRQDVADATFAAVRRLRDALFLIGPRISLQLAAETDPQRIERMINDEHRTVLHELSRTFGIAAADGAA